VDSANNLFFEVGNGNFDATNGVGLNMGTASETFRLRDGLAVADYFTPYNQASLPLRSDLGSGGPVLLPDVVQHHHQHLILALAKREKFTSLTATTWAIFMLPTTAR